MSRWPCACPSIRASLISLFHDQGQVENVEHGRGGVVIEGNLPGRLLARFQPFLIGEPEEPVLAEGDDEEVEAFMDDDEDDQDDEELDDVNETYDEDDEDEDDLPLDELTFDDKSI